MEIADIRNRNALHYAADAGCSEGCELILETAHRHGCAADLVNMAEKYIGAEQCFLVRGKNVNNRQLCQYVNHTSSFNFLKSENLVTVSFKVKI